MADRVIFTPTLTSASVIVMQQLIKLYKEAGEPVSLYKLAKTVPYSHSYLEKIFNNLRAVSLVRSTRGPGGGYSPCSTEMSVGEIIRATRCNGFLSYKKIINFLDTVSITQLDN